jgi:hypothetical protein
VGELPNSSGGYYCSLTGEEINGKEAWKPEDVSLAPDLIFLYFLLLVKDVETAVPARLFL